MKASAHQTNRTTELSPLCPFPGDMLNKDGHGACPQALKEKGHVPADVWPLQPPQRKPPTSLPVPPTPPWHHPLALTELPHICPALPTYSWGKRLSRKFKEMGNISTPKWNTHSVPMVCYTQC